MKHNSSILCFSAAAFVALFLSSCSSSNSQQVNSTAPAGPSPSTIALQKCESMLDDGAFTQNTAVPYHRCLYDFHNKFHPYRNDIDKALDAKRLELSELFAARKITAAQFEARINEYQVQMNNLKLERSNQQMNAESNREAANAASRAANAANSYRTTNCYKYSNSISCNSY